jgi:hypothetical protein
MDYTICRYFTVVIYKDANKTPIKDINVYGQIEMIH